MLNESSKERKFKIYFYAIILVLAIPQFIYRFKHPELTETELFFNFFEVYREFFTK